LPHLEVGVARSSLSSIHFYIILAYQAYVFANPPTFPLTQESVTIERFGCGFSFTRVNKRQPKSHSILIASS